MVQYIALMVGVSTLGLAAWTVFFRDLHRTRLFLTSLWLFALPISFLVYDNYVLGLLSAIPYFAFIVFEESLKLVASRVARNGREAFAIVLLFGLWEAVITKTSRVFFQNPEFYELLNASGIVYSIISVTSILMHATTAGIYALFRTKNFIVPFLLSLVVHLVFNYTRDFYFYEKAGRIEIRFSFILIDAIFFGLAWLALWKFYRWRGKTGIAVTVH